MVQPRGLGWATRGDRVPGPPGLFPDLQDRKPTRAGSRERVGGAVFSEVRAAEAGRWALRSSQFSSGAAA